MAALRYGLMSATVLVLLASRMPAGDEKKISLAGDWAVTAMSKDGNAAPAQLLENVFIRATATTIVPVAKKDQKEDERSKLEYKIVGAKEIDFERLGRVGGAVVDFADADDDGGAVCGKGHAVVLCVAAGLAAALLA